MASTSPTQDPIQNEDPSQQDDLKVMTRSFKLPYSNHYSDQELKMHTAPALLLQL